MALALVPIAPREADSRKRIDEPLDGQCCVIPLFFRGHLSFPDACDLVFLLAREEHWKQ